MVMAPAPERFCVDSCDLDKEETVVLAVPRKKHLPRYNFHEMLTYCRENKKEINELTLEEMEKFLI